MAMHAKPIPSNPYNPLPISEDSSGHENSQAIRYPSPFVPIRMPIFALVLWLNDRIVSLLSVGGGSGRHHDSNPGITDDRRRRRGLSDSTVESVEEGTVGEAQFTAAYRSRASPSIRLNNLSSRRKVD